MMMIRLNLCEFTEFDTVGNQQIKFKCMRSTYMIKFIDKFLFHFIFHKYFLLNDCCSTCSCSGTPEWQIHTSSQSCVWIIMWNQHMPLYIDFTRILGKKSKANKKNVPIIEFESITRFKSKLYESRFKSHFFMYPFWKTKCWMFMLICSRFQESWNIYRKYMKFLRREKWKSERRTWRVKHRKPPDMDFFSSYSFFLIQFTTYFVVE